MCDSKNQPGPVRLINCNFDISGLDEICLRAVSTESLNAILELIHVTNPLIRKSLEPKYRNRADQTMETFDELLHKG